MCHLENCQHENSGEWHLSCRPHLRLAPITKIKNVSSFREELNQTVMEIGQVSTVRSLGYSCLLGLLCVRAQSLLLCLTLCNSLDCNPASSSVREILHARILEWVDTPFCRGSSQPRIKPASPAMHLLAEASGKPSRKLCLLPVPFCHEGLLWVSGGDQRDGNIMGCIPFSFVQQWQSVFFS